METVVKLQGIVRSGGDEGIACAGCRQTYAGRHLSHPGGTLRGDRECADEIDSDDELEVLHIVRRAVALYRRHCRAHTGLRELHRDETERW